MRNRFHFSVLHPVVFAAWLAGEKAHGGDAARGYPVKASRGMAVTGQDLATRAGLEVLKKGGNDVAYFCLESRNQKS